MYTTIKTFKTIDKKILLFKVINATCFLFVMPNIVDYLTYFSLAKFLFVFMLVFAPIFAKADVFYFGNHYSNGAAVSIGSGQTASAIVGFRFVVPDVTVITVNSTISQKPVAVVQTVSTGLMSSYKVKKNKEDHTLDFILTGQTFSTNRQTKFEVSSENSFQVTKEIKLVNQINNDFVEIPIQSYSDPTDNKGISKFKVVGKINSADFKNKAGSYVANMTLAVNLL